MDVKLFVLSEFISDNMLIFAPVFDMDASMDISEFAFHKFSISKSKSVLKNPYP